MTTAAVRGARSEDDRNHILDMNAISALPSIHSCLRLSRNHLVSHLWPNSLLIGLMVGALAAVHAAQGCTPLDKQTDRSFGSISLGCGEECIPGRDVSDTYVITRVVGPGTPGFQNSDGSLSNPDQAVSNGVVSSEACMNAHISLDPAGTVSASLILNGTTIGSWSYTSPPGQDGVYELNTVIHVPIQLLKFATKSTNS
jgi:hypothetical protein